MSEQLLLDTHPLLWWLAGAEMDRRAVERIAEPANLVMVSAASIWEIAIKGRLGKLRFEGAPRDKVRAAGFDELVITAAHAEAADDLTGPPPGSVRPDAAGAGPARAAHPGDPGPGLRRLPAAHAPLLTRPARQAISTMRGRCKDAPRAHAGGLVTGPAYRTSTSGGR